tara:strand:- start:4492 stop:4704 length:213 start_codon:yes stop_codon:yes gene_type:complete
MKTIKEIGIEKAYWHDLNWFDTSDNNQGYIYGIHYIAEEEVLEAEWFKSKAKRDQDFNACIKLGYKSLIN